MANPLQVLILDFDGVVVESNDVKTQAFEHVFAQFPQHANAMMAYHHEHVSLTRFAKFDHLAGLLNRPDDAQLKAKLAADFSKQVLAGMMRVPLVPGADAFLQWANTRFPVYLASVTPEPELKLILSERNLNAWFKAVYGCPPWTKPKAIIDVLLKEHVQPENALLVGDSAGDQLAANETGVKFLARNSGLSFNSPAPLTFADLDEIRQYLRAVVSG
jgi:phosphoglycolate phosphatase-like HAD superfamily hydrolase